MSEPDLSRLPTGDRSWHELVEWAAASDDRLERHYLELKSDVDLTTKAGRHKVAKFILGASHRDPVKAAPYFGGHAVMLLGVGRGAASGIPPFEAMDLEQDVEKFAGVNGPGWDHRRIPAKDGRDVVAIIVDPPSGGIWPCLADGDGLNDGDIYIRKDGRTPKATGREVQAILARSRKPTLPDIDVDVIGHVHAIDIDHDSIREWVEAEAHSLLQDLVPRNRIVPVPIMKTDRRSEGEFRRDVERWEQAAKADPISGLRDVAAHMPPLVVRITNRSQTPLHKVKLELELHASVHVVERADEHEVPTLFEDRPPRWGMDNWLANTGYVASLASQIQGDDRRLVIEGRRNPQRLSLTIDLLRAEETLTTDDDQVVVFGAVEDVGDIVTCRWRITTGDVPGVLEGERSIEVNHVEPTARLLKHLGLGSGDEWDRLGEPGSVVMEP